MIRVKRHFRKTKRGKEFVRAYNRKEREERGKRNRAKGLRFEFRALAKAKKTHPTIMHNTGSRGFFDIVMEEPDRMRYWVVKENSYVTPLERKMLKKYMETKPKFVQIELIYRKHKKDMSRFIMSEKGSKQIKYFDRTKLPKKSFSSTPNVQQTGQILDMVP